MITRKSPDMMYMYLYLYLYSKENYSYAKMLSMFWDPFSDPKIQFCHGQTDIYVYKVSHTLIKESHHDVDNPDQLRVLAFSTLS